MLRVGGGPVEIFSCDWLFILAGLKSDILRITDRFWSYEVVPISFPKKESLDLDFLISKKRACSS